MTAILKSVLVLSATAMAFVLANPLMPASTTDFSVVQGAAHAKQGRGADDKAGHVRQGRGADDGANHK